MIIRVSSVFKTNILSFQGPLLPEGKLVMHFYLAKHAQDLQSQIKFPLADAIHHNWDAKQPAMSFKTRISNQISPFNCTKHQPNVSVTSV